MRSGVYSATIDGVIHTIKLLRDEIIEVNGIAHKYDFAILGDGSTSLILDGKMFVSRRLRNQTGLESEPLNNTSFGRTISLGIDGRDYHVRVDDEHSLMVKSHSSHRQTTGGSYAVRAPMPGLITRIEVTPGTEVVPGKGLLVLEAMKMENEIRSQRRGKVETIHAEVGKAVEKGELLISITEL